MAELAENMGGEVGEIVHVESGIRTNFGVLRDEELQLQSSFLDLKFVHLPNYKIN